MILDRRPLLALALGGLLVTGIAVMLVTRPLWHQMFTPRVLASVVITAVIVIVPTVLELVPPTVRMVWGLAFVAFGGVAALATALVHLTRGSPEVLHAEDALSLGMVGGLVAGGGRRAGGEGRPAAARGGRGAPRLGGGAERRGVRSGLRLWLGRRTAAELVGGPGGRGGSRGPGAAHGPAGFRSSTCDRMTASATRVIWFCP
ncbi:hypothetical protein ACFSTC_02845 [Nonomuraea ferruginea]